MSLAAIWLLFGIFLVFSEFIIPGFVILFFGVGAILTAGLVQCLDVPMWGQIAFFVVTSLLALILGRKIFKLTFKGKVIQCADASVDLDSNGMVGQIGTVTDDICPPLSGRVFVRGSDWTAVSDNQISKGARVRVTQCNNITLTVEEV